MASPSAPTPPLRLAAILGAEPLAELPPARLAAAERLQALRVWNDSGRLPLQNGIVRPLPVPRQIRLEPENRIGSWQLSTGGAASRVPSESRVWSTEVVVSEAYRLRLHLSQVSLPPEVRIWVYGAGGESVGPFGRELISPAGELWTPSVGGPTLGLEVEISEAQVESPQPFGFVVDQIAEIVPVGTAASSSHFPNDGQREMGCLVDGRCVGENTLDGIGLLRRAIASLQFVNRASSFVCSGGLLNDEISSLTPYLLTANHCFSTPESALTLEAFWDFFTDECGGLVPSLVGLPRSSGAALLATSTVSDFTLVRLNRVPAGRAFLGWDADPASVMPGTVVHRLSHPVYLASLQPQIYTRYEVTSSPRTCNDDRAPARPLDDSAKFIHSLARLGGTFGGSSGAPLVLDGGYVVGQLFGACGPRPSDGCAGALNDEVDGAFSATFPYVSEWLSAEPVNGYLTTAELPDFRFRISITSDDGTILGANEPCIADAICVSGALRGRPEVFVRIAGPRPNGYLWVYLVRFTPAEISAEIERISSGERRVYLLQKVPRDSRDLPGVIDRYAFAP